MKKIFILTLAIMLVLLIMCICLDAILLKLFQRDPDSMTLIIALGIVILVCFIGSVLDAIASELKQSIVRTPKACLSWVYGIITVISLVWSYFSYREGLSEMSHFYLEMVFPILMGIYSFFLTIISISARNGISH